METYCVKGEEKKQVLDGNYTKFEREVTTTELIELLKNPKVIVWEVSRRTAKGHK